MMRTLLIMAAIAPIAAHAGEGPNGLRLFPGYITQIHCEGRLLISAVGDEHLVRLEALPESMGCGVLLKPKASQGRTNIILETSTGTIRRIVTIEGHTQGPLETDLEHFLKGAAR